MGWCRIQFGERGTRVSHSAFVCLRSVVMGIIEHTPKVVVACVRGIVWLGEVFSTICRFSCAVCSYSVVLKSVLLDWIIHFGEKLLRILQRAKTGKRRKSIAAQGFYLIQPTSKHIEIGFRLWLLHSFAHSAHTQNTHGHILRAMRTNCIFAHGIVLMMTFI